MKDYQDFLSRFNFREEMTAFVGIERERFLSDSSGRLMPVADRFLSEIGDTLWTHELSACQVEDRTNPLTHLEDIKSAIQVNNEQGKRIAKKMGLHLRTIEVASEHMSLDVYPEPRYLRIKNSLTREQLSAACRVTGTHLHFGMPNLETAISVVNCLREHIEALSILGDHSNGERLQLYRIVAPIWEPPCYQGENHFFEVACEQKFADNPRNCWHLVRISIHGTVELRMLGATDDLEEICQWITMIREIIKVAL